jgi:hypothetical protein
MVRPGVWKLTVTVGRYADGSQRRVHTTVHAANMLEANRALARFVSEVRNSSLPASKPDRAITVDEAVEQFLIEPPLPGCPASARPSRREPSGGAIAAPLGGPPREGPCRPGLGPALAGWSPDESPSALHVRAGRIKSGNKRI